MNNLKKIDGVERVHHLHVWSLDGSSAYMTAHIVADGDFYDIKLRIKTELKEHGIAHSVLEFEKEGDECDERKCTVTSACICTHRHHHHH